MDFDLSEEQRLLKDSIDGLLKSSYDFEARKKYRAEAGGYSKTMWGKFAEQGLLGLPFSEDDGGFGAGPIETMIVMEALGRNLVIEPYLELDRLNAKSLLARSDTVERVAISSEMLWRSRQLLGQTVEDEGPLPDS
jgi:Acyl-CoA dehydrogenase, N-terminal domain